jgi:hypothetical protein
MPTREAECVVCGLWPSSLRLAMRCAVNSLPLREHVCDGCEEAFWANVVRLQDQRSG